MEADQERYASFIEPLLATPQSTYEHVTSLAEVFRPGTGALHAQQHGPGGSEQNSSNVNKSLLFIANLTIRSGRKEDPNYAGAVSKHMLHTFYNNMLRHTESDLHKYGLVRMLAWLPDEDKASIIPRTVMSRTKQAIQWELVAAVNEVAGGNFYQESPLLYRRQLEVDLESQRLIARKPLRGSLKAPAQRLPPSPQPPSANLPLDEAGLTAMRRSPHRPAWTDELVDLEQKCTAGALEMISKQYKRLKVLRAKRATAYNWHQQCLEITHSQRTLDRYERNLATSSHNSPGTSRVDLGAHHDLATTLRGDRLRLPNHNAKLVNKYIDDQRAFDSDPPVLAWDRRNAEPLWANKDEFFPERTLALVDFQPDPSFMTRLDTHDKKLCFDHVVSLLFQLPGNTVRKALEGLVHDGVEQFLERVPSLLDPLQGGKADLDELRIRSLPVQLFVDLALAWESWPFRPNSSTFNLQSGQHAMVQDTTTKNVC